MFCYGKVGSLLAAADKIETVWSKVIKLLVVVSDESTTGGSGLVEARRLAVIVGGWRQVQEAGMNAS